MEYRIALVGKGNDGKTTYITKLVNGNFTHIADTISIKFHLNIGDVKIHFIEANNLHEMDFSKIDGLIVMFDLNNIDKLDSYIQSLDLVSKNIPKVLVGNKSDLSITKIINDEVLDYWNNISSKNIFEIFRKNYSEIFDRFWLTSAKYNYNIDKPILSIITKLVKKDIWFNFPNTLTCKLNNN